MVISGTPKSIFYPVATSITRPVAVSVDTYPMAVFDLDNKEIDPPPQPHHTGHSIARAPKERQNQFIGNCRMDTSLDPSPSLIIYLRPIATKIVI